MKKGISDIEKEKLLEPLLWDVTINASQAANILEEKSEPVNGIDKKFLYLKILQGTRWYTILRYFDMNEIKTMLDVAIVNKIFPQTLRKKYVAARKILFG